MATAAKGKTPTADDIMPVAAMKALLKKVKNEGPDASEAEPKQHISAAIAMSESGEGVILLDRKLKPKKLSKLLIKNARDLKFSLDERGIRFGRASLAEDDETVLKIAVNKPPSGAKLHLEIRKRVKPAGFTDVILEVDESLEAEPEEDTPQTAAAPAPAAPPPPTPDLAALTHRLAGLIKQVQAIPDAARQATLATLAREANVLLKSQNLFEASQQMDTLEAQLTAPPAQSAAEAPHTQTPLDKSLQAWVLARRKVNGEVEKLKTAVVAAYAEMGLGPKLAAAYHDKVEWVLEQLDERVTTALGALSQASSTGNQSALVGKAREAIGDYITFLNTDQTVQALDSNPFTPVAIRSTLAATLTALDKVVKQTPATA